MDVFSIPHDPSIVIIDWGYPIFPEEWGTQNHIIAFDISNIKVNFGVYRSEFYGNPCPIADLC